MSSIERSQHAVNLSELEHALSVLLSERIIVFHPIFVDVAGSITAGLLLSYLWQHLGHPEREGKTLPLSPTEIGTVTRLTRTEQETARRELRALGYTGEERAGMPARLHVSLNRHRVLSEIARRLVESSPHVASETIALRQFAGNLQSGDGSEVESDRQFAGNLQTGGGSQAESDRQFAGNLQSGATTPSPPTPPHVLLREGSGTTPRVGRSVCTDGVVGSTDVKPEELVLTPSVTATKRQARPKAGDDITAAEVERFRVAYNAHAKRAGWRECASTSGRAAHIRARLAEHRDISWWEGVFQHASTCGFLNGTVPTFDGSFWKNCSVDFFIRPGKAEMVLEGKYDDSRFIRHKAQQVDPRMHVGGEDIAPASVGREELSQLARYVRDAGGQNASVARVTETIASEIEAIDITMPMSQIATRLEEIERTSTDRLLPLLDEAQMAYLRTLIEETKTPEQSPGVANRHAKAVTSKFVRETFGMPRIELA